MTIIDMRNFRTSKAKDVVYIFFFGLSVLLLLGYLMMLYDSLTSRRFNYLEADDFVWIGVLMLGFILIDFLITRRFIRRAKKKNR
jgi:hypothetical protein